MTYFSICTNIIVWQLTIGVENIMKEKKILYQIRTLNNMIVKCFKSDSYIDNLSLTPTQMQIMEYILDNHDIDIYQKDLEEVLNLTRATVSGVLFTMEKNGLIKRVANIKDARVKQIVLNESAEKIFLKKKRILEDLEKIIVNDLSSEDLESFLKVINIMKENIKNNY